MIVGGGGSNKSIYFDSKCLLFAPLPFSSDSSPSWLPNSDSTLASDSEQDRSMPEPVSFVCSIFTLDLLEDVNGGYGRGGYGNNGYGNNGYYGNQGYGGNGYGNNGYYGNQGGYGGGRGAYGNVGLGVNPGVGGVVGGLLG